MLEQDLLRQQAASILLGRRRARRSISEFSMMVDVPGKPATDDEDEWRFHPIETQIAQHHHLIMSEVQRCVETHMGRLMIFLPPGAAKSTYASVVAPTWFMGAIPGFRVIGASYGTDLARKLGRRARSVVRCPQFRGIFDTTISADSGAAHEWALTNGSEYMGGGILSGIGGNRAELLSVDDPHKNREEAESKTIRRKVLDEFQDTLLTRLVPGGSIVIIQTRWHLEDLSGSILPADWDGESGDIMCRDGQVWRVLCIPAICDRADDPLGRQIGDGLWPEWFGRDHWRQFERVARTWASLFQQRPTVAEGTFFKRDWFPALPKSEEPAIKRKVRRWDLASTPEGGDYIVGALMGEDEFGGCGILDVKRDQLSPAGVKKLLLKTAEDDGPTVTQWLPQEPAAAGKILRADLADWLSEHPVRFVTENGKKHIRAMPLAAAAENGRVWLRRADWNGTFLDELAAFSEEISEDGGDQVDDQVDAASGGYTALFQRKERTAAAGPRVRDQTKMNRASDGTGSR